MALSSGTQIGPYLIVDQIGSGGMGEVYRATDTKLGRDIAIKTLPSTLAREPDRLARFEREAKLLATLNHAHIGAIYGLDEHEGTQFIAMELVEGQTLEEKLKDGPLPVEDALQIALQIAEALEAAHEKGVMHRDLKPANIMLTPDGVVKVLDFGLAKAFSGDPNEASPAHSPALSMAMTQQGLILGTAGYMSPEQASGQATDQRADIWAFGVVLYEMLTGLPLFSGESVPHILADVLRSEPGWNRLPKNLNPRLRLLLERCLKKKVRDRYHSIADARVDIEEILRAPHDVIAAADTTAQPMQPLWRRAIPVTVAAIVAIIVGLGLGVLWPEPEPESPAVVRFDYDVPENQTISTPGLRHFLTFAPDGRRFAYNTTGGIYLRALGDLDARLIPGTETPLSSPVFSPDGQWVAYVESGGLLKRIAISGGAPVVIADGLGNPRGMRWEADGTILIGQTGGIVRVSANGGTPELIIEASDDGTWTMAPELLPDGDSVIFTKTRPGALETAQVAVQSLTTGEQKVLIEGGSEAHYLPTGHLVYTIDDGLFAIAFDLETLTVSGGAIPLVQGIMRAEGVGLTNYSVSNNGTLVYASGDVVSEARTLVWVDRDGREEAIDAAPPRAYTNARISPDGTTVALDIRDQEYDIWTWNLLRQTLTRLTFDAGQDEFPVWSPDGRRIAYTSTPISGTGAASIVLWRTADGTGSEESLAGSPGQAFAESFTPDASELLVFGTASAAGNGDDIGVVQVESGDEVTPLLATGFEESYPAISPDGLWMAYVSDESGGEEVYVRPFPDVDAGRWQVSTGGGTQPLWSRDGTELFYRSGEAMMVVDIETESSFVAGNPEPLFADNYVLVQGGPNYDVSLDAERFLMIKPVQRPAGTVQVIVVENWFTELERLLPMD